MIDVDVVINVIVVDDRSTKFLRLRFWFTTRRLSHFGAKNFCPPIQICQEMSKRSKKSFRSKFRSKMADFGQFRWALFS